MIRVSITVTTGTGSDDVTVTDDKGQFVLPVLFSALRTTIDRHADELPVINHMVKTLADLIAGAGLQPDPKTPAPAGDTTTQGET